MNGIEFTKLALLVAGLLALSGQATPVSGQERDISGVVRDSINGEPLPNASVGIVAVGQRVLTDEFGRFSLVGVPAGSQVIRVEALGYRPTDFSWDDPAEGSLELRVLPQAVELEGVSVEASPELLGSSERISEITLPPSTLSALPALGETDVFRGLQLLPGVSGTNDASSGLFVRGGTPDENLVLLDGMTLYHVDHFFGVFSAFNSDAIKDVRLFKGGFPARFGGRTSSVVEMVGKTGNVDEFRVSGGINLLSARALAEVPLGGRGSWLVSARRSYTDVLQSGLYNDIFGTLSGTENDDGTIRTGSFGSGSPIAQAETPSFYFYDLNSKATYTPTDRDVLSLSLYGGRDKLDESLLGQTGPGGQAPDTLDFTDLTEWGSRGTSARWSRLWSSRFTSDVLASYSTYFSDNRTGADAGFFARSFEEENEVRDFTVRVDNVLRLGPDRELGFGVQHTDHRVTYDRVEQQGDSIVGALDLSGTGALTSAYLQSDATHFGRLHLTTGVRLSHYEPTAEVYFEPRLSGRFQVTDRVTAKAAWGRFRQFVKRVENEDILEGSRDFWVLAGEDLQPAAATHLIAGLSYETSSYLFDIEGYDKALDGISQFSVRSQEGVDQDLSTAFFEGTGTARGVEVLAQKKGVRLSGWVSYALSEVVHDLAGFNDDRPFPATHDQRHEVKVVGTYRIEGWTLSSSFTYGSGSPYTLPQAQYPLRLLDGTTFNYVNVGEKNAFRLPAYQRLDISGTRRFETARWYIDVNASLLNVLGSKNVWYRQFDLTQAPLSITDVSSLGFTPSVGISIGMR